MKTSFSRCRLIGASAGSVLGLAGLLAGCAAPSAVVHKEPSLTEWKAPGETARSVERPPAALPPAVATTPLKPPPVPAARLPADRTLPTTLVGNLDLADEADVATVLRTLGKAAGVNMLVSPQVSGKISFTFQNVPWDQAFRSVILSAGLAYAWEGDVLRVMTIADMKRNLEMDTILKQREDVKAGKRMVEPLLIQVIPIKYAKAKNVGATVRTLLAAAGPPGAPDNAATATRTGISIDEENNAIIVHAIREEVDKAIALVEQLDRAKAQVHIEARIVEASRDAARQLGVQWGAGAARVDNGRLNTFGGRGVTYGGYNSDFAAPFAQPAAAGLAPVAPVGMTLGLISEEIGGSELLSMQLTALAQKGRIQILSSPSITTLDNEPAIVESGEERAYQKSSSTGIGADIEWKKAVLKLEVIPHVVDEEYLRVEIIANKDAFDETKPASNGEFPVNTKHASTTVLLRNGDTVVIGGLSMETESSTDAGIPGLMDLPGIGGLFKNRSKAKNFDETLIFVTPKIIAGRR